jgi:hypothetical protein
MSLRYLRLLAATLVTGLLIVLSSTYFAVTQAQTLEGDSLANSARTLPHRPARITLRAPAIGPATAVFPATISEDFEGTWPADGWTLQDFGTSGGEYLLGQRDCNPESGSYAGWTVGGGADGANLSCGDNYPENVYSVATYGPFDLTNAVSSTVTYSFTGASELDVDVLFVGVSLNGSDYCGVTYSGDYSDGYVQGSIDLGDLNCSGLPPSMLGDANVTLAVSFSSNDYVNKVGFTIDNLALTTTENAPTATETATETPTETPSSTPTPTDTPTDMPTSTPTDTSTNTPTDTPTATPTDTPTSTPTPTDTPTSTPTSTPTEVPATSLNLTVAGLDPSQAVQTASQSVPLVAGRPLIVRVTVNVQNSSQPVLGVTAQLHGMRNGVELANSPLSPFNIGGSFAAPLAPNRESFGDTLNFEAPADWTNGGPLVLWAEVNPSRSVGESTYSDNRSADLTLNFVNVPTLQIMLVPIAYQPNGQGPVMRPDLTSNNQGLTNLQALYPIADVQPTLHSEYLFTGVLTGNGWSQLLNQLTQMRNRELGGAAGTSHLVYYGVVPQAAVVGLTSFTAGIGWVGGNILTSVGLEQSVGVAAHEIGHNLGLNHAPCGVAGDPNYPFADGRTGDVGVDVYHRQIHPPADKDFMSYCQPIWVSAYHYIKMLSALAPPALSAAQSPALGEGLLIAGSILSDTVSGQLSPSVPISTTRTDASGGIGAYRVELRDANDVVQYSRSFVPEAIDTHTSAPDYGFSFVAPRIANLGSIQLWKDNTLLAKQIASRVQPDLTAAVVDASNAITVNWQASSSDRSPVTVALRYSADNGLSWRMLALNLTGDSFTIDKRNLPGGSGQLEVSAVNTTQMRAVTLHIGTIENKASVVSIAGPPVVQQYTNQPLLLQAVALDIEDGYLQGNSLVWTDEQGRVLGVGETLWLPTGLPLGVHTLTLTATDSAGAKSVDTVQITVIPLPDSSNKIYSDYQPLILNR